MPGSIPQTGSDLESSLDLGRGLGESTPVSVSRPIPEGWIPARIRLESGIPVVEWRPLGDATFREPFYEDTLRAALANHEVGEHRVRSGVDVLEELASRSPEIPVCGIIHHWSRCGSTLVSQMLTTEPGNLVLSEAPPHRYTAPMGCAGRSICQGKSHLGSSGMGEGIGERDAASLSGFSEDGLLACVAIAFGRGGISGCPMDFPVSGSARGLGFA